MVHWSASIHTVSTVSIHGIHIHITDTTHLEVRTIKMDDYRTFYIPDQDLID